MVRTKLGRGDVGLPAQKINKKARRKGYYSDPGQSADHDDF